MSAPSGPVQVIPPGLLGMLQLKNVGQLPDLLQGNIQPTLELRDWMLHANEEYQLASLNQALGTYDSTMFSMNTPVIIPQGQWWYVHNITAYLVLGNTDTLNGGFSIGVEPLPNVLQMALADKAYSAFTAAGATTLSLSASPGDFFPPGTEFGIGVGRMVLAAARVHFLTLRFTRLPI